MNDQDDGGDDDDLDLVFVDNSESGDDVLERDDSAVDDDLGLTVVNNGEGGDDVCVLERVDDENDDDNDGVDGDLDLIDDGEE